MGTVGSDDQPTIFDYGGATARTTANPVNLSVLRGHLTDVEILTQFRAGLDGRIYQKLIENSSSRSNCIVDSI
jgi:hypothetical protein